MTHHVFCVKLFGVLGVVYCLWRHTVHFPINGGLRTSLSCYTTLMVPCDLHMSFSDCGKP